MVVRDVERTPVKIWRWDRLGKRLEGGEGRKSRVLLRCSIMRSSSATCMHYVCNGTYVSALTMHMGNFIAKMNGRCQNGQAFPKAATVTDIDRRWCNSTAMLNSVSSNGQRPMYNCSAMEVRKILGKSCRAVWSQRVPGEDLSTDMKLRFSLLIHNVDDRSSRITHEREKLIN